jgi:hypothetical protein
MVLIQEFKQINDELREFWVKEPEKREYINQFQNILSDYVAAYRDMYIAYWAVKRGENKSVKFVKEFFEEVITNFQKLKELALRINKANIIISLENEEKIINEWKRGINKLK